MGSLAFIKFRAIAWAFSSLPSALPFSIPLLSPNAYIPSVANVEFLKNVEVEKVYAGKLLLLLMDLINGIIQILCVLKMLNNKLYPLADKQGLHCTNG